MDTGHDPEGPEGPARAGLDPDGGEELLGRLEQRLDRASDAAERLIAHAAAAAIGTPPPAGWQRPRAQDADERAGGRASEIELLLDALGSLRERIPPDLQRRVGEALRELLLALRALIDWYLERSQRRRAPATAVQDIPIL